VLGIAGEGEPDLEARARAGEPAGPTLDGGGIGPEIGYFAVTERIEREAEHARQAHEGAMHVEARQSPSSRDDLTAGGQAHRKAGERRRQL
jgi:hypothetical protein